jgi:DNA-binding transcriptional LysR family regulator
VHIKGLRVFVGVVRDGSLALAARQLNISQPAASRLLRLFEDWIGAPLFTRNRQRLTITPAGEALYPEAARILAAIEEMPLLVNAFRENQWRPMRIVSQPRVLEAMVMPAVEKLSDMMPAVNFKIEVFPRRYMGVRLSRGGFDIGISTMPVPAENLTVHPICKVAICAVLAKDHPLAGRDSLNPAELVGSSYIALDETTAIRRLIEQQHAGIHDRLTVRHEVSSTFTALQMVRRGMGFTFVDPTAMDPTVASELAIVPLSPRTELDVAIFLPRQVDVHPARAAFIELLQTLDKSQLYTFAQADRSA